MKHSRTRAAVVAATALAALAATVAPAHAERVVIDDGADATASLSDIRKVNVDHRVDQVKVRINVPDLRKDADASISAFFDTKARRKGPEFGVGLPLFSGSDYMLVPMRKWKASGEPVECSYALDLKWKRDVAVFTADRGCFDDPTRIRVGLHMRDLADGSHVVSDWLIGRRSFTPWLDAR